jgi:hypothetical protein
MTDTVRFPLGHASRGIRPAHSADPDIHPGISSDWPLNSSPRGGEGFSSRSWCKAGRLPLDFSLKHSRYSRNQPCSSHDRAVPTNRLAWSARRILWRAAAFLPHLLDGAVGGKIVASGALMTERLRVASLCSSAVVVPPMAASAKPRGASGEPGFHRGLLAGHTEEILWRRVGQRRIRRQPQSFHVDQALLSCRRCDTSRSACARAPRRVPSVDLIDPARRRVSRFEGCRGE